MGKSNQLEWLSPISLGRLLLFWLPLAGMWLLMSIEQPLAAAFITRLPEAKLNLASYGVAKSIAMILESPVIVMMTVGNALGAGRHSYRKILNLMHICAVSLTGLHLLLGLSPIYALIIDNIIGAPPEIIEASRVAFLVMAPSAALLGYRRVWQGVLIRHGKTGVISLTMLARIAAVSLVLLTGVSTRIVSGAVLGAMAGTAGFLVCAVLAYVCYRYFVKPKLQENEPAGLRLTWRALLRFSVPLTVTYLIYVAARPLLAAGLARAPMPLESLALWPVLQGYLFLFSAVGMSLQEAVIAVLQNRQNLPLLRRVTYAVSAALLGIYLAIAATPVLGIWFRSVAGLESDLLALVQIPIFLLAVAPSAVTLSSLYRGMLVLGRRTLEITLGGAVNVVCLGAILVVGLLTLPLSGAAIASFAMGGAYCAQTFYMWLRSRKLAK